MNELQREYGPRGVQLVAINSNDPHLYPDERLSRMVERATEDGYAFPYLVDEGQRVARAYGAECTFHVFVLDQDRRLRYRGRFDDARLPERVTTPRPAGRAGRHPGRARRPASGDPTVRVQSRPRVT